MKQSQINRSAMYSATNSYLDTHSAVWNAIPVVNTYKSKLVEIMSNIKSKALDQEAAQVFVGASLVELKHQISIKMDILDDALEAYADDIDDPELLSMAANSKTSYFKLPNEDFETKTKNMLDLLSGRVAEMGDYGTSKEQLNEVKLSFGNYQERRGKPRSYQVASKVATLELEDLFKEGTKVLDKLDKVLKRFKRSNTAFYNGYLTARTIIDN